MQEAVVRCGQNENLIAQHVRAVVESDLFNLILE